GVESGSFRVRGSRDGTASAARDRIKMSADLAARLRSLAHDHQAGRLSLAAYRKLRAPLLDSLALHGTRAADEKTQPRAVARSPELSRASRAPEPPPLEARRNVYWQAAIAFAVVLAIAGGLF